MALSNSILGVPLMAGGLSGLLAEFAGEPIVLAVFGGISTAAAVTALTLREVQRAIS